VIILTTSDLIKLVVIAAIGYLLGSVNSSLLVGRLYGVDVRKYGSGNAGATNTLRTLGKSAALFTTLGDLLKGFISCLIGFYLITGKGFTMNIFHRTSIEDMGLMVGGLAAILGHNWPIYFRFKGGKGVLTSFIVILMMNWEIGLLALGLFIIIAAITRFISLGSILCAVVLPFIGLLLKQSIEFIVFSSILALLIVIRHKGNIERIIKGSESKFSFKKKADKTITNLKEA